MPARPKTAPASGTPLALRYLESYLEGFTNRKRATKALLGCSERTAGRLTSRVKPYRAPMKIEWVSRICGAVGKPVGLITGSIKPRNWEKCLIGWSHAVNPHEALRFATDCALAIAYRALTEYEMSGSFAVGYTGGWPREVVVSLSSAPELDILGGKLRQHRIILTSEQGFNGGKRHMKIQHVGPGVDPQDKTFLTPQLAENTITRIHALTKSLRTDLQRENGRSTP